ncbi:endolytic transglycosylase MltG [Asticcacaulis sp. BYS171W]|uniref:Endolytic murein transglycosylase n=1 Tax=Asticcacaulis aquaticus TaxID=2984212 RepID=A0ABT5HPK0_9CAUL|nr:endolytic transglycosylase MltG [Asticcacaulis aquaticus]MDC7681992.1 endolytic transglycosylase MltG [Asticcacaulis aquaticus]
MAKKKARPAPRRKSRRLMAPVAGLLSGIVLLLLAAGLFVYANTYGPGPSAKSGQVTAVVVERGQGLNAIAKKLKAAGVIRSVAAFRLAAKFDGRDTSLRAGTYEFASRLSMMGVLDQILEGRVVQHFVTIPEGRTSAMAVRILMATDGLKGDVEVPPEGSILPETYQYEIGETRQAVLDRMLAAGRETLDDLWAKRAPNLPIKSKEEALILASVVEKETGIASERPKVAAVFVNRLRTGMRLQSDPTVVYGVSKGEPLGRGLKRSELDTPTPWNTYLIDGLPVTPIANPGKAALEAVLNPPETKDVYFVADGTGGHVFAETYDQHLINVAKWRVIEADGGKIQTDAAQTVAKEGQ